MSNPLNQGDDRPSTVLATMQLPPSQQLLSTVTFLEAGHTRRYFVDACHPVWGLSLVFSCWLLVGQRFLVGMGSGRKRLNILGAYCPDDQEYLDLRLTRDNRASAAEMLGLSRQSLYAKLRRHGLIGDEEGDDGAA